MRILYLDLASHDGLLACVTDEAVAASAPVSHRIDDAALMPLVEGALANAGWSHRDLTQIACVIGPGGFTSLRVAVALANVLSHELKIPSCGIHLSDVYQFRVTGFGLRDPVTCNSQLANGLWLHSTKKHELFVRKAREEPQCETIDELRNMLTNGIQWTGELIPEHRKIIDESGAKEVPLRSLEKILPEFLKQQTYKKQILTPWYGRGW